MMSYNDWLIYESFNNAQVAIFILYYAHLFTPVTNTTTNIGPVANSVETNKLLLGGDLSESEHLTVLPLMFLHNALPHSQDNNSNFNALVSRNEAEILDGYFLKYLISPIDIFK